MPKAQKGVGVDKYPGLKEFATRVYRQTPSAEHESLRLLLNHFVNQAKASGDATQINWANQSINTLKAKFGTPPMHTSSSSLKGIGREPNSSLPSHSPAHSSTISGTQTAYVPPSSPSSLSAPQGKNTAARFKTTNPLRVSKQTTTKSRVQNPQKPSVFDLEHTHTNNREPKGESPLSMSNGAISWDGQEKGHPAKQPLIQGHMGGAQIHSQSNLASHLVSTGARKTESIPSAARKQTKSKSQNRAAVQELRRARFESPSASESPYMELHTDGPIRGTSQKLEKSYFRLTGQVNTSVVRPPEIIEQALDFVYSKYEQDRSNYAYISDQFKSLRQDLTVQHVVSPLTVRVYEYNARVAIEHDDLGEYNQCSTQLQTLYATARELTDKRAASEMLQNEKEFQAYVVYYKIFVGAWEELGLLLRELEIDTGSSSKKSRATPGSSALQRAIDCVTIVTTGQKLALFECWRKATSLESRLIGKFAVREQLRSLEAMARATLQQSQVLPLEFLGRGLGMKRLDETCAFLDNWKVPHTGTSMSSADALPLITQAVAAVSGPADIKGQI